MGLKAEANEEGLKTVDYFTQSKRSSVGGQRRACWKYFWSNKVYQVELFRMKMLSVTFKRVTFWKQIFVLLKEKAKRLSASMSTPRNMQDKLNWSTLLSPDIKQRQDYPGKCNVSSLTR